jgi:hypothetical protein
MKLTRVTLLLLLSVFISSNVSFSQVKTTSSSWKAPTFSIDIIGSFDLPVQEARGNIGDFFTYKNYGTKIGFGAQFNFKFGLGRYGQYRPYLTLGYAQLENTDNNVAYIDSNNTHFYPLKGSQVYSSTPGKSKMIIRNPYLGAGFEYAFTMADKKKRMYIPFVGVEFLLNVITGIYRQTPTNSPNASLAGLEVPFTIKSDVRFGIGAGAGMNIRFGKGLGIVFGAKYKLANLIGKSSNLLVEENKMNLLDKASTDLNSNLSNNRNIGYMELYLGATIFMGKTKK